MGSPPVPWAVAALVGVSLVASCTGTRPGAEQTSPVAGAGGARYPYTEADVRFMSAMIGHHAQAVRMAGWAATNAADGLVRRLAERIINGQQDEIATMQQWLRDRDRPVPEGHPAEPAAHGTGHGPLMPGMLTDAQMNQLAEAKGAEFDRLFLTYMIQHHRGAVSMVKTLLATQGAAQDETVFRFANDVQVDQSTEIARMERLLSSLPAGEDAS